MLDQVFKMTERRFQVARRLVKNKPWDYFMMVEMGPDRLHHVFWQYFDPRHPLYVPGNEFETAFQDYYRFLDRRGRLAAGASCPTTPSRSSCRDHGARPMMGGLCFNDWLMQEGYLAMTETRHRAHADREGADRLEPHDRVGRRRLLRPAAS